jgi:hypothetical protein
MNITLLARLGLVLSCSNTSAMLSAQALPLGNIPDPLRVEESLQSLPDPVASHKKRSISITYN